MMNVKLLKELYKQAETECGWSEEKFAELIVRECAVPMITQARAMDAHGGYKNNPVEVTAMNLHQGLLKHFGVEE